MPGSVRRWAISAISFSISSLVAYSSLSFSLLSSMEAMSAFDGGALHRCRALVQI